MRREGYPEGRRLQRPSPLAGEGARGTRAGEGADPLRTSHKREKSMTKLPRHPRELRKQSTAAETAAWWLLRNRQVLGLKFRRQCPLGRFVVDFYCPEAQLVIELDGSVHSQPCQIKKDRAKDGFLRLMGLRVLRVPNGLVLEDPDAFRSKISEAVGVVVQKI